MKKSNKKIPKTHLPKYSGGGLGMVGKDLKNTGLFLADMGLAEWAPNAITQDQYSDTKYGANLGKIDSMNESFSSQSPIRKNVSKMWTDDRSSGMNEEQQKAFNQVQPIAKVGSSIGEMWTTKGLSGIGQGSTDAAGNFQPSKANGFAKSLGDLSQAGTKNYTPNMYDNNSQTTVGDLNSSRRASMYPNGGMNMQPNAIPQYPNGGKIPKLKPRDFKAEKAHYEEQTRGANQADGSGISSAELAYRYSKLIDPTGATSAVEIGKNFYNGNPQDPIDYLGLIRIPYTKEGMKAISKLSKAGNKANIISNTITKTNDVAEAYAYGGYSQADKYGNGGAVPIEFANSEVEKQENTLNPDGTTTQFDGPSHEQGGIPTQLDPGTLIFSDKLKQNGKTFADLNKPNMTHKEDKILSDSKASTMSKITANLMKEAKNKSSIKLFESQESLKQSRLDNYIKRLGGIQKYPNGGQITPQQYKQAQADSMTLYKSGLNPRMENYQYPGYNDAYLRLNDVNRQPPSSTNNTVTFQGKDYTGATSQFQKPTMIPYNQQISNPVAPNVTNITPVQKQPVYHPQYGQSIDGIPKSSTFKYGGRMLPKFLTGGRYVDGVWVEDNQPMQGFQADTWQQSSGPVNNVGNTTSNGTMITNEDFNKFKDSSHAASNNQIVNQGSKREVQLGIDIQRLAAQEMSGDANTISNKQYNPRVTDPKSNKFDWKGLGTQGAYFAANNAGNIYDLARADKTETRKYNRATENLVTPNFRDADQKYLYMKNALKGASLGASGYLANLQQAHVNNVLNKAQIQQAADNTNAGIKNQVSQYNTGIANEEILANAKIRANARNIKQSAIASIGSNSANQMNDVRNTEMDQKKLDGLVKMYPALAKNPEMLKYIMSFKNS